MKEHLYTQAWKQLKTRHKECHRVILELVKYIFEGNGNELIVGSNYEKLQPAVQLGIAKLDGNKLSFSNENAQLYVIAQYVVKEKLLPCWEEPKNFTETLWEVKRRELQLKIRGLAKQSLILLHNEYRKDVVKQMCVIADDKSLFFNLYHSFTKALPELKVESCTLKEALSKIQKATENDLTNNLIYEAIEKLCINQPETGESLYKIIINTPNAPEAAFIPCILKGLSTHDFSAIHKKAIVLSQNNTIKLAQLGMFTLSVLDYNGEERKSKLRETLCLYEEFRKNRLKIYASDLVRGYGNLLQYENKIKKYLVELSQQDNLPVQYQLSHVLWRIGKERGHQKWFKTILMNLKGVGSRDKGTVENIDSVLYELLQKEPEFVCNFLEEWITNRVDKDRSDKTITEGFGLTFQTMREQHLKTLERCITNWFNADDARLHVASAVIVHDLSYKYSHKELQLDTELLNKMSCEDVIFTMHKILGYVANGNALCSLIFSVLDRGSRDDNIVENIVDSFVRYVNLNFPGLSGDFLKKHTKHENKNKADVAKRILEIVEQYYNALKKLPRLLELEPDTQRIHRLAVAMNKKNQQLLSEALKSSIVNLFAKVNLKDGTSSFQELNGSFTERSKLHEVSQAMEVPRGEQINPLEQEYLRLSWRRETREGSA